MIENRQVTRDDVIAGWRKRRDELERLGASVNGAAICDQVLADLAAVFESEHSEPLTLTGAVRESGYSADHLARLVRAGRIPNAGNRGRPRIRRGDLPIRPRIERDRVGGYDPHTDARSLGTRR